MINWEKELEAIFNDPLLADVEVVAKWKVYNVKSICPSEHIVLQRDLSFLILFRIFQ